MILLAAQASVLDTTSDRKAEALHAEAEKALRELRNAPYEVYRNGGGTALIIKAGDIDAWTPNNQLIWVTIDTSRNPIYRSGSSKELWRLDCKAKTQAIEITQSFDRAGNLAKIYEPPQTPALDEIIPGSPIDRVRVAFCPPEYE